MARAMTWSASRSGRTPCCRKASHPHSARVRERHRRGCRTGCRFPRTSRGWRRARERARARARGGAHAPSAPVRRGDGAPPPPAWRRRRPRCARRGTRNARHEFQVPDAASPSGISACGRLPVDDDQGRGVERADPRLRASGAAPPQRARSRHGIRRRDLVVHALVRPFSASAFAAPKSMHAEGVLQADDSAFHGLQQREARASVRTGQTAIWTDSGTSKRVSGLGCHSRSRGRR